MALKDLIVKGETNPTIKLNSDKTIMQATLYTNQVPKFKFQKTEKPSYTKNHNLTTKTRDIKHRNLKTH